MKTKSFQWPNDTTEEAARLQIETLRRMDISERAEMTMQLSETLRQITKAGIRYRHPEYSKDQVTQAYLRLILDPDLFRQVFPGCEISA